MNKLVIALVCTLVGAALHAAAAAAAPDAAAERTSLDAQRALIESAFAKAGAECRTRFVVTACVDDARLRRREALAELATREQVLVTAERRERALARERQISLKQAQAASRPALAASAPGARPARPVEPAASRPVGPRQALPESRSSSELEQIRRAAYERRQQSAQARRTAVEQRNQKRWQEAGRAAPLPLPAASAAH